jgi:hypothetical protein
MKRKRMKFTLAREIVAYQATVLHSNCSFFSLSCFHSLSSVVAAFFCLTPSVSLFICLSLDLFLFYYLIFLYCNVDLFPYFYPFPTFCWVLFIFSFLYSFLLLLFSVNRLFSFYFCLSSCFSLVSFANVANCVLPCSEVSSAASVARLPTKCHLCRLLPVACVS